MLNKIRVAFFMYFKKDIFEFNIDSPASDLEFFL